MRHRPRDQEFRNRAWLELARSLKISYLATNGVKYARPDGKELFDVMTCIREKVTIANAGYRLNPNAERHLKSPEEMARLFARWPHAIAATREFADALDFSLDPLVQKNITLQGSFSHNWPIWERILRLLSTGALNIRPIIGGVWPLAQWKDAFEAMHSGRIAKATALPATAGQSGCSTATARPDDWSFTKLPSLAVTVASKMLMSPMKSAT